VAKNGKSESGSGFFWGLVLGIIVGAVLAMLFAPQPGDETREQLAQQSVELRKRGEIRAEQLKADLMDRYGDAITQGKEAYERARGEVLTRYNKAKHAE
jgi:gas vesicle protein